MHSIEKEMIVVHVHIHAPIDVVWKKWTTPSDITKWYFASEDWHTPRASNDLRVGGRFLTRMEAVDGSAGFDFEGIYDVVKINECLEYHLEDERKVKIVFTSKGNDTEVVEHFDAETMNPLEMQRQGWQAILNHFKSYTEAP